MSENVGSLLVRFVAAIWQQLTAIHLPFDAHFNHYHWWELMGINAMNCDAPPSRIMPPPMWKCLFNIRHRAFRVAGANWCWKAHPRVGKCFIVKETPPGLRPPVYTRRPLSTLFLNVKKRNPRASKREPWGPQDQQRTIEMSSRMESGKKSRIMLKCKPWQLRNYGVSLKGYEKNNFHLASESSPNVAENVFKTALKCITNRSGCNVEKTTK